MSFSSAGLFAFEEICYEQDFIIPEFQRGYAWQEEQWRSLWEDAATMVGREHVHHYGGAIMVSDRPQGEAVELIDGQQRMTSTALLLSALGAKTFKIRFRNNDALQTYYDYYALSEQQLAPRLQQYRSYYTRNLESAAEYFKQRAQGLDEQQRDDLAQALLKRFKLFVLVIQPEFDIHVAFETINGRGRPLSTLERLKNRLIYLAARAADQAAGKVAMAEIHRCWQGVYASLGAGKTLLGDDDFLRAHALGWFKHKRDAEWLNTELFDVAFSTRGDVDPDEIVVYVRSLELAAACWQHLNEPSELPVGIVRRLDSWQKVPSATTKPMLLWALVRLAQDDPEFIRKPGLAKNWVAAYEQLVFEAERFCALVLLGNGRQSSTCQNDLNHAAYVLAHPEYSFYMSAPAGTPPSGPAATALEAVELATDYVASLTGCYETHDPEHPRDPRFPWAGEFSTESVRTVIADRLRGKTGFYNWQLGKLMIYLWEDRLRGDRGKQHKKPWEKFAWDESVEHVYPQRPEKHWSNFVSFDGRTGPAMRNAVTNSIGNLLLLSRPINSSVSNGPYANTGEAVGKRERYASGSHSEIQIATLCSEWSVVQIAARGIAMMRLAQKTWNFELVSDDAKLTDWLPILFGDQAQDIRDGAASGQKRIDGRALQPWVDKFEKGLA